MAAWSMTASSSMRRWSRQKGPSDRTQPWRSRQAWIPRHMPSSVRTQTKRHCVCRQRAATAMSNDLFRRLHGLRGRNRCARKNGGLLWGENAGSSRRNRRLAQTLSRRLAIRYECRTDDSPQDCPLLRCVLIAANFSC